MKLQPRYEPLDALLARLGKKPVPFTLDVAARPWTEIEQELTLDQLDLPTPDKVLRVRGEPIFLYIRDKPLKHSSVEEAQANAHDYSRFHVADCGTLEDMKRKNRFERYVVTNRYRGPFRMHLHCRATNTVYETELDLKVCKNCLEALNWEGYRSAKNDNSRQEIWRSFSREVFLERYSPTFSARPKRRDTDAPDTYSPNWDFIRDEALRRANYRCEECGVRVPMEKKWLLDVHHINGVKSDNNPENLRVLCKLCHNRQPNHQHYRVNSQVRADIERLRREQGIRVG